VELPEIEMRTEHRLARQKNRRAIRLQLPAVWQILMQLCQVTDFATSVLKRLKFCKNSFFLKW